jgi:hypothetical protein
MELDPRVGPYNGYVPAWLFLFRAYGSDRGALEMLDTDVPLATSDDTNFSEGSRLMNVIEGLSVLEETARVAELYPRVSEIAKKVPLLYYSSLQSQTVAGIAASAGARWNEAVEHFETSLNQAREFPNKLEQPRVRYWFAKMLTERRAPGDRERARQLLGEALEAYESIDFPRHRGMAHELLSQL